MAIATPAIPLLPPLVWEHMQVHTLGWIRQAKNKRELIKMGWLSLKMQSKAIQCYVEKWMSRIED